MAVIVHRILAADDKDARSGFDDIVSNCLELVNSHDSLDLWEQSFEQTKVAKATRQVAVSPPASDVG